MYCIICIVSRCPLSQDELKELYSTHHAQLDSEMAAESEKLKTKSKDSVQDTKEAEEEGKKVPVDINEEKKGPAVDKKGDVEEKKGPAEGSQLEKNKM